MDYEKCHLNSGFDLQQGLNILFEDEKLKKLQRKDHTQGKHDSDTFYILHLIVNFKIACQIGCNNLELDVKL